MIGELTAAQVEHLLATSTVGRIGCHSGGRTYVVPIAYAYDGEAIYAHSGEGLKLEMMRSDPEVCFEIERLENMANWETVIAWGRFEELSGAAARAGMERLIRHLSPLVTGAADDVTDRLEPLVEELVTRALSHGVVFRVRLTEKTGRFEQGTLSSSQAAQSLGHRSS